MTKIKIATPVAPEAVDAVTNDRQPDNSEGIAFRPAPMDVPTQPSIQLDRLDAKNSFLVSINPPMRPSGDVKHVPCDVVLVIDVSGSMASPAPLPRVEGEETAEPEQGANQLSVLDLVRHACKTIISTLDPRDRLALVTFSDNADVLQSLTSMTAEAKTSVVKEVDYVAAYGATNLWDGIKTGLEQFETFSPVGNVQGLYVLTDGQPNCMCPPQGYVRKLRPLLEKLSSINGSSPTIQTFGFGYSIRSDLMLSIAEVGNGSYAFIPDVGMIGTVFIHAVANFYTTFATNAVLTITAPDQLGAEEVLVHNSGLKTEQLKPNQLRINLGNIIYGQSRDVVISYPPDVWRGEPGHVVDVELLYNLPEVRTNRSITMAVPFDQPLVRLKQELNYHLNRNELCKLLSELYPISLEDEKHTTIPAQQVADHLPKFKSLVEQISSCLGTDSEPNLTSLLSDLVGPQLDSTHPENGQVYQALQTEPRTEGTRVSQSYWSQWGRHYLSSLWCAHMRQTCNSFKDAGPLRYGVDSDLFKHCRDELDTAFDNLPAPVGTRSQLDYQNNIPPSGTRNQPVNMSSYNRYDNVCFLGSCTVVLAGSGQAIKIEDLQPGMEIRSPLSGRTRKIAEIIESRTGDKNQEICRIGSGLWITPWHPILHSATVSGSSAGAEKRWVFPSQIANETRTLHVQEAVYSILLAPSDDVDDHTVQVEGVVCVTLGHGIVTMVAAMSPSYNDENNDIRAHPFFGNYEAIRHSLDAAPLPLDRKGHRLCCGVLRDAITGLACGLLAPPCSPSSISADSSTRHTHDLGDHAHRAVAGDDIDVFVDFDMHGQDLRDKKNINPVGSDDGSAGVILNARL